MCQPFLIAGDTRHHLLSPSFPPSFLNSMYLGWQLCFILRFEGASKGAIGVIVRLSCVAGNVQYLEMTLNESTDDRMARRFLLHVMRL